MQSIRPIVSKLEMDGVGVIRKFYASNESYKSSFEMLAKHRISELSEEALLVFTAKLLAVYQETLITPSTPFDRFRQALILNNLDAMGQYPVTAQKGLKIFVGKGRCGLCHFGPTFSNMEFADIGISHFTKAGVDKGGFQGVADLHKEQI